MHLFKGSDLYFEIIVVPLTPHAGTLLASAGDDGTVRLWRANYLNVWRPVSVIAPGGSPETGLPIPPPLYTVLIDPGQAAAAATLANSSASIRGVSQLGGGGETATPQKTVPTDTAVPGKLKLPS